jgi:hypothetical protein
VSSNPAEVDGFSMAIKSDYDFFRREAKRSVPCRKIRRPIKGPYEFERYSVGKIQLLYFSSSFSCFATRCSVGDCQRALLGESGMIINKMGTHNRSNSRGAKVASCAHPTRIVLLEIVYLWNFIDY